MAGAAFVAVFAGGKGEMGVVLGEGVELLCWECGGFVYDEVLGFGEAAAGFIGGEE